MAFQRTKSQRNSRRNNLRRSDSNLSDSSTSSVQSVRIRRDSLIRRFPPTILNNVQIPEDGVDALPPRNGQIQSYMIRDQNQTVVMVDVLRALRGKEEENELANSLEQDLNDFAQDVGLQGNLIPDRIIVRAVPGAEQDTRQMLDGIVGRLNSRLDQSERLALDGDPERVNLEEGATGWSFRLIRDGGQEARREQQEDESEEEDSLSSDIILFDEDPDIMVPIQTGPVPQVVQPENPPVFVPPVNPPPNMPADTLPVLISVEGFRKAMDFGRIFNPSKELRNVFEALQRYQNRVQQFRDDTIQNGFDQGRMDTAIQDLNREAERVVQVSAAYQQKTNTEDKRRVVSTMLRDLGAANAAENHLLRATRDIIPPNYIQTIQNMNSGTASAVYTVNTGRRIGNSETENGIAKGELGPNDPGGATMMNLINSFSVSNSLTLGTELGMSDQTTIGTVAQGLNPSRNLKKVPSLLARQVLSSRLDKALGINVLADEEFMRRPSDNSVWGVTAFAKGKQVKKETKRDNRTFDIHQWFPLFNSQIQKGLSDLQLMDAITGQMDRHTGNLFIDSATGQVTGIDNDMAFPFSVEDSSTFLRGQFSRINGQLTYHQTLIDRASGEKVLAMSDDQFRAILRGQPDDPSRLSEEGDFAESVALERFQAVKRRIQQLKDSKQLVETWDNNTFRRAMDDSERSGQYNFKNYLITIADGFIKAQRDPNRELSFQ